jgi:hypothetical protein
MGIEPAGASIFDTYLTFAIIIITNVRFGHVCGLAAMYDMVEGNAWRD